MESSKDIFYLSEHFESIQGEGNYAGVYSLFLRFHFCNLTCTWCDTKYTWFGSNLNFRQYNRSELKEIISNTKAHHIIFTGGEPTFYQLDELVVPGKKYHVETNGTYIPIHPLSVAINENTTLRRSAMDETIISQFNWVVSPKLSNSRQDINVESMIFWASRSYCIFKFVIRNLTDLKEVEKMIAQYHLDTSRVYISLEGQTAESQLKPEMVDEIIKHGLNYSPRLHVMLWGAKRGK